MTRTERKQYTELKTDRQTAAELARVLDKHFGFIETTTPNKRYRQKAFYDGLFCATELLFDVKEISEANTISSPIPRTEQHGGELPPISAEQLGGATPPPPHKKIIL